MPRRRRPGPPDGSEPRPVSGEAEAPRAAAAGPPASPEGLPAAGERSARPESRASFATSRPVAVAVVFLAAIVFGALSYFRLPLALMPELSYPTLTVRTEYPGAAPEEVENEVSRPIEEALGVIGGLRRLSSVSRAGVSDVVLEFSWDTAMADAVQDTLEKLDQVLLPEAAERPLVLRFDPSLDPVMELSLTGEGERFAGEEGLRRLRRIGELQVKRALEPIPGVAAVQVRGGLDEEIHVLLDEAELSRTGLTIGDVIDRLRQENVNVAGGTLKEGTTEYMVRTLNEYQNLGQIADTVVARLDGREVRVGDLGRVERGHRERQILTRTGGADSVRLEVYKEADANMVTLAQQVRQALGDWEDAKQPEPGAEGAAEGEAGEKARHRGRHDRGDAPLALAPRLYRDEGVQLGIVADRSEFIRSSIAELRSNAVVGGLLAVAVLFLFLGQGRATGIVAVAIPASILVSFAPLNVFGVSLNIMSLGGLALGIGLLVDSSIVVLESIFRCREEGDPLVTAVVRGTAEVRAAVTASTLTNIAVFAPMVFVEGVAGQAFGHLAFAVIVSNLAALAVALWLLPMLASRQGAPLRGVGEGFRLIRFHAWRQFRTDLRGGWRLLLVPYLLLRLVLGTLIEVVGFLLLGLLLVVTALVALAARFVVRPLGTALRRGPVRATQGTLDRVQGGYRRLLGRALARPAVVVTLFVAALGLTGWIFTSIGSELLPEVHQGEITFELSLPPGTPLEETVATLQPVERAVLAEQGAIESLLVTYGFDPLQAQRADEGEHTARFKVVLAAADPEVEERVVEDLRRRFAAIPGLDQRVTRPVLFSFRTPIEVEVRGDRLEQLQDQGEQVRQALAELPEVADVETTLRSGAPEVEVVYDRELLARYGLNLGQVAERVRNLVRGFEASRFDIGDRRIPLVVRLREDDRRAVDDVRELVVNPGGERPIPLAAVAAVQLGEGPSEVRRIDGRRVALVRANLGEASLGEAVAAIEARLARLDWPAGLTWEITGQHQEWQRSAGSLWLALGLAVFLVYVIMAAQFESLLHPFLLLFSIPLAFFGSALVLWATGASLSIVVFLGMILLAGIVVNNAIVLVDYTNLLRSRGMAVREALMTAGQVRLRPILMTTGTTVLGLLPLALGVGDGAELRAPMAVTVISGLLVSTVLTLLVIPVLYSLLEAGRERLLGGRRAEDEEEAAALFEAGAA
ncbi:MAG TPA: efflux RND transporter permease subunit [Thermoanaerobaculia bacterium]|nr:efflux RND transporter permease subunit [Thermoanaerobaculia bacterium]